ncbi:MAG: hypothetical protein QW735_00760 [archaeon]
MPSDRGMSALDALNMQVQTLNSKVEVVAQRMKVIEKNEQIIGKTLISHNKTLKELEDGLAALKAEKKEEFQQQFAAALEELKEKIASFEEDLKSLKSQVEYARLGVDALKSDLSKLEYALEAINPVLYVTIDQIGELIEQKIEEALSKKK